MSNIGLLWKVTNTTYNVKKFAGTGGGALLAALLAVGYDLENVLEILDNRLLHNLLSGNHYYLSAAFADFKIVSMAVRSKRYML